jgi:pimeloyl-ACP methyl ester carboxylesterase
LLPEVSPIEIHYRERGSGMPLIFLHGGWGYEVYPFDQQIAEFSRDFRILIPDRTGFGRSRRIEKLPLDFHQAAAVESAAFLDALGIHRGVLWGHSDGAVIAANMAINHPDRYAAIILEAVHYDRLKPRSREYFANVIKDPDSLGERTSTALARDHGEDYWRSVLKSGGEAWIEIARTAHLPERDLFGQRLAQLKSPTILIHGEDDPRTEPGELDRIKQLIPQASLHLIAGGGHSPHSKRAAADQCTRIAREFLRAVLDGQPITEMNQAWE